MDNNIKKAVKEYIKNPFPLKINCEIMNGEKGYYWGDTKFIPKLLNFKNPDKKPFAELWIGAHKNAPAKTIINNSEINLFDLINIAGKKILGEKAYKKFGNNLPFLLKLLSSAHPLSIQAHPNKKQAENGWKRENGKGPNYKDANHKPELISAITDFWALIGFRNINDIIKQFEKLNIKEFSPALNKLKSDVKSNKKESLKTFYASIMNIHQNKKNKIIKKVLFRSKIKFLFFIIFFSFIKKHYKFSREYWIIKAEKSLKLAIKKDILNGKIIINEKNEKTKKALYGLINIYLLNLIHLNPGQAVFLPAGELHSYLKGTGIEIMGNSDNVLRGGLTHKHIDMDELLKILTFKSRIPEIINPIKKSETEKFYKTPVDEFELSTIKLFNNNIYKNSTNHNAEAFLVLKGSCEVIDSKNNSLHVSKGDTFFIPSIIGKYTIKPKSNYVKLYKAGIPQN